MITKSIGHILFHNTQSCRFDRVLANGSGNQGVEEGINPLTITPNDTLRKFVFSVPTTLYSIGIEIWSPEKELLTKGLARAPLTINCCLVTWVACVHPKASRQQEE